MVASFTCANPVAVMQTNNSTIGERESFPIIACCHGNQLLSKSCNSSLGHLNDSVISMWTFIGLFDICLRQVSSSIPVHPLLSECGTKTKTCVNCLIGKRQAGHSDADRLEKSHCETICTDYLDLVLLIC